MISLQNSNEPYPVEKIISALTYLTAGFVGFIWLIIAAFTKKTVRPFLMYHILQSIFLSILFYLLSVLGQMVYVILYRIPVINAIPYFINMPLPLIGLSLIQVLTTTVILYLAVTAFMGMYSYIPWVSDVIKGNTSR